jgi:hypothetical protein
MSDRTKLRLAQILIPSAVVIGVASAILGNWFTVIAMVLLIVMQITNWRAIKRRAGTDGDRPRTL